MRIISKIEHLVMPNHLHDLADMRAKIEFLLFPACGQISVLGQGNRLRLRVGKEE